MQGNWHSKNSTCKKILVLQPKSLDKSCLVSNSYETEIEIVRLGPVGNTEKKNGLIQGICHVFKGKNIQNFFKNTVESPLQSYIK